MYLCDFRASLGLCMRVDVGAGERHPRVAAPCKDEREDGRKKGYFIFYRHHGPHSLFLFPSLRKSEEICKMNVVTMKIEELDWVEKDELGWIFLFFTEAFSLFFFFGGIFHA